MSDQQDIAMVLDMLHAIEARELDGLPALYEPDVRFIWQPGLPYGGDHGGTALPEVLARFQTIWEPIQATADLRRMDPKVVGTGSGGRVVIRYWWRGEAPGAGRHEAETLAEYVVRNGRLARAQMFHFDLLGLLGFLRRAGVSAL